MPQAPAIWSILFCYSGNSALTFEPYIVISKVPKTMQRFWAERFVIFDRLSDERRDRDSSFGFLIELYLLVWKFKGFPRNFKQKTLKKIEVIMKELNPEITSETYLFDNCSFLGTYNNNTSCLWRLSKNVAYFGFTMNYLWKTPLWLFLAPDVI